MKANLIRMCIPLITLIFSTAASAAPSVESFFKNPEFTNMQLSPNGKYLATLAPIGGHRNIVVLKTADLREVKQITGLTGQDVAGYFWANDDVIVFTMDEDGNEAFGLYAINTDAKRPAIRTLVKPEVGQSGIRFAQVVSTLPDDPDHIIVQWNKRKPSYFNLYRINVRKGQPVLLGQNVKDVTSWLVDHDGVPRGAYKISGLKGSFLYRSDSDSEFRVLQEANILDESITPLVFAYDNKTLYVSSNVGRDKSAIYTFNPETNELGPMLLGHDDVDVDGLIMSHKRKKLIGASYFDDYPQVHYFDDEERGIHDGLKEAFPDQQVNIVSMSRDEQLNVLLVTSDRDPGSYYLYDRSSGQVRFLVSRMGWLSPDDMAAMRPFSFEARDGMLIRGYLTLPRDWKQGQRIPLIVNPHGGPFGVRDFWGYNPEHQFFASRGYGIVQVNYRGSGGYGRNFEQAGYGKWGREMQHDISDAVEHLVAEGITDPNRVCIYGGSYGGYATMAGLTFTPDLYRCGINYVGVTRRCSAVRVDAATLGAVQRSHEGADRGSA